MILKTEVMILNFKEIKNTLYQNKNLFFMQLLLYIYIYIYLLLYIYI